MGVTQSKSIQSIPSQSGDNREKAIILLSGGLDSTVSLALARKQYAVVKALTFNYGQRAYGKEIKASRRIAEHYHVPHQVIALPWLAAMLPPAMQSQHRNAVDWNPQEEAFFEASPVWVPNRNGVLLNIAASFAEYHQASVVIFGANAEEAERFPDNSEAYRQAVMQSLALSTLNQVRVECPVGAWNKAQMIAVSAELNVPLQLVWSCYGDADQQCGVCPSCYRFKQALATQALNTTQQTLSPVFAS